MYMDDYKSLLLVVGLCFILANLGKVFSTFAILLVAFNVYVILGFGGIKDKIKTTSGEIYNKASDACKKYIPRYTEDSETVSSVSEAISDATADTPLRRFQE